MLRRQAKLKITIWAHLRLIIRLAQQLFRAMNEGRSNAQGTPKRTPIPSRPYLGVPHMLHHSPQNHSGTFTPHMIQETNSVASEEAKMIYGTNISANSVIEQLKRFVLEFEIAKTMDGQTITEKIYYDKMSDIDLMELKTFEVSGMHLKEFDREIYLQFIYFPAEMICCFDYVLKSLYEEFFIKTEIDEAKILEKNAKREQLMIDIKNLDEITCIRNLSPSHINRLISFRGIAIRSSEINPEMKVACFQCTTCYTQVRVPLENAKVQQPTKCANRGCLQKNTMEIIHNLCEFTDKQYIKFQQLLEYIPEGETPNSLTIISYDSNVDGIRAGDRVEVVGIYRAQSSKMQRGKNDLKSVYNIYVDLISFKILEDNRFKAISSNDVTVFSDDEKIKFAQIADRESVIDDLVASFAPSIFGHEDIKKGILTQLFSGTKKDFSQSGRGRFRSDINICLVGDPSTAKSQMLQQVFKIAPRGIYTSGRGSSAVGLTANVRKDPETREFILESGALVLSDLGICCIDEFDKMTENSRTILLEAMEQQTISIAKAGIVCQLNSRTSILAAANPVNSRYDPKKSVVENINLGPALLSRFDLIYIMLDLPEDRHDRNLSTHLLNIYSGKPIQDINRGKYDRDVLARYITYAKEYVHPVITQSVGKRLAAAYLQMRQVGSSKKVISATPRQLESLIRISEAFAKMRLSNEVEESDVEEAIRLIKVATQQAATDPTTGVIDMDSLTTGKTISSKKKIEKITSHALQILRANSSTYKKMSNVRQFFEQVEKLMNEKLTEREVEDTLVWMCSEDVIIRNEKSKSTPQFKLKKDLTHS